MKEQLKDSSAAQPGGGSVRHVLVMVLALVSFGVGHQWSKLKEDSSPTPVAETAPQEEEMEVREAKDFELAAPAAPRRVETFNRTTLPPPADGARSESAPQARQLVKSLTQIDFSRGQLTPEQVAQWKAAIQELIQQGASAVPAIQEFLELNRDWDFGPANPLGFPSLRTAFLHALEQIGGPEAQSLLLRTLQTTAVPAEIARAARSLERQAPGQFLEEIRTAVRETLAHAVTGQLAGWDVGPLLGVLQSHGNASAVPELEKYASTWNYYSALTLANLPAGAGIPALVKLAQESSGAASRSAAVEALAQVAFQYPAATVGLLELARSGQLPEKSWLAAASALEGTRYFIRDTGLESSAVPNGPGVKSYILPRSGQRFYSTPAWGGMSVEQIQRRVAIIDQLLALNPSTAAAQALQNARASLLANGQQVSAN